MYTSFIGLCIDMNKEEGVILMLSGMDNVTEIYAMMQPFDVFVKVYADNLKKLETTVEDILKIDGVQKSFNFLAVQQKKG